MKKCLFIAPVFFDYEKTIINNMKKLGIETVFFPDKVRLTSFELILTKLFPFLKKRKISKYVSSIISKVNDVDYVFFIQGIDFHESALSALKKKFSEACFIYYAWDSTRTFPSIISISRFFDRVFSFDPDDCQVYGWKFIPLFYGDEFNCYNCSIDSDRKNDFVLLSSFYPQKREYLDRICEVVPNDKKLFRYMYISSFLQFLYFKVFYPQKMRGLRKSFFQFKPMDRAEVASLFFQSRIVLDTPLPSQKGLSVRIISALRAGCKIVTTNESIRDYDFYSSNNIYILAEEESCIPSGFIDTPFLNTINMEKYSCLSFIKSIFEGLIK